MLTHADIALSEDPEAMAAFEAERVRMLTYADVCRRLLTYADARRHRAVGRSGGNGGVRSRARPYADVC
jgi:hypothetical protein